MAEERSRVALRHMVLFSPQQSASSQERTHICSEQRDYLPVSHQEAEKIKSATKAFITLISPESYCMLLLSISPFCTFHHPSLCLRHLLISKQLYAISQAQGVARGRITALG